MSAGGNFISLICIIQKYSYALRIATCEKLNPKRCITKPDFTIIFDKILIINYLETSGNRKSLVEFKCQLNETQLKSTLPVISAGISRPINVSTVGARSAKIPSFSFNSGFDLSTRKSGTGLVV